jgi:hypothetical protein
MVRVAYMSCREHGDLNLRLCLKNSCLLNISIVTAWSVSKDSKLEGSNYDSVVDELVNDLCSNGDQESLPPALCTFGVSSLDGRGLRVRG